MRNLVGAKNSFMSKVSMSAGSLIDSVNPDIFRSFAVSASSMQHIIRLSPRADSLVTLSFNFFLILLEKDALFRDHLANQ